MSESSVKASMVCFKYGVGAKPIMTYEATPLPDSSFIIRRSDGTCLQLALGDTMPSVGKVGLDVNGNLTVGDYTVPVGLSLSKQFVAKPTNKEKTEFALLDQSGKIRERYKLGEQTKKGTLIEQDEYGNLKLGDISIKVLPVQMKISFQIQKDIPYDEASKLGLYKAQRAVFNVYSGKDLTRGTATFGYFIPKGKFSSGKRIGEFKELYEGELVTTAELYPVGSNSNIASLRIRRPEVAYEAAVLFQEKIEIQNALKGLSDDSKVSRAKATAGVDISDSLSKRFGDRLSLIDSKLDEISKQWEFSEVFTVRNGRDYLKSMTPQKVSEPEPA